MTLQELIDSHSATIATLRQKLAQNDQERSTLLASLIRELGYLEGLQAALGLAIPAKETPSTDSGILAEKVQPT